jgi:Na+/proline symporter
MKDLCQHVTDDTPNEGMIHRAAHAWRTKRLLPGFVSGLILVGVAAAATMPTSSSGARATSSRRRRAHRRTRHSRGAQPALAISRRAAVVPLSSWRSR